MTDDTTAEREAAGMALLHETFARWRDMPPVRLTLHRRDAWTILLAMQAVSTHPGLAASSWGPAMVAVGRRFQEAAADDPEVYAYAEQAWDAHDTGAAAGDPDADAAGIRLMTDAYTRWESMPAVTVTAARIDTWALLTGIQLALRHPEFSADGPIGRITESVGRQIQESLCDTAELYALAETGWDPTWDVDANEGER